MIARDPTAWQGHNRNQITTKDSKKSNTCNHRGHRGTRRRFENQKQKRRKEQEENTGGHEVKRGKGRANGKK